MGIDELSIKQDELAVAIQKTIANYKKAPLDRRSAEFIVSKARELDNLWMHFEKLDNIIRDQHGKEVNHPYFVKDVHSAIRSKYREARDEMDKAEKATKFVQTTSKTGTEGLETVRSPQPATRSETNIAPRQNIAPGPSTMKTAATQHVAEKTPILRASSETSIQHGLVRKMTSRMATLRRTLENIQAVQENQPVQFYKIKLSNINHLWNQIELVYDELWEHFEDPAVAGFDQAEYDQLDEMVQYQLVELSIRADQCQGFAENQTMRSTVQLPKVTLPQFNGDYLKWQQFSDLFSQMIDKQPIAAVQKMWYLKANVTGEAAKLISHFSSTENNYVAAWTLLQERYNNRRVIVSTLIEKLVNQPSGTSTASTMKNLHDTTRECIMALDNLGVDTKAWDPILFHLLLKKLDRATHMRFEQSLTNPKELQKVDDFLLFLEGQFHTLEAIGIKDKGALPQLSSKVVSSITTSSNSCKLCDNGNHPLYYCKKFLKLSPTERQSWVKKQRLCVNCFKNDHTSTNCKSRCCCKCDKKHNTLLHVENENQRQQGAKIPSGKDISNIPNATVSSAAVSKVSTQGYVLLATARIKITAANGNSGEFRAILDSGSQINIVSERLMKRLSISPTKASLCIEGIGDAQKKVTQRLNVKMQSISGSFTTNLEAFVLPSIITAQPNLQLDTSNWKIPANLQLADPEFYKQDKIDILLGAEFHFSLMIPGHIKLMTTGPILQNTSLGWIVSGKCESTEPSAESLTCAVFGIKTDTNNRDGPLIEAIEKLWKMDEFETTEKSMSLAEQQCETHFLQNMCKNDQGRFIVKLPFLENPAVLGESRVMAHNRFLGLERRLQRNVEIRKQYVEFMREYERLGHMTQVNLNSMPSPKYFIPHHCVLKPESTTTKLRVVFDASAKTTTGYALNDIMHTGPTVQSELFSILLRFRLPRFVFTTDIEKMYRQILIHPEDQQYQVIIWREDPTAEIKYYQLNTVTYGTRSAPYLATKCLQEIANNYMLSHHLGAQMLHDNFYVDDGLGGSDSLATAIEMQQQLIKILSTHGFNLRKWCANHPKLLKNIPQGDHEVNLDFSKDNNDSIKTLGLLWLPKADVFCIRTTLDPVRAITKRTISSDLARLFDPLGLLAPVIVKAKIFIQHLWQIKLSWDEALPSDLDATWTAFRENLSNLNDLKIHRHIFKGELSSSTQLHIFTDASEKAFGAAAYLRTTLKDGRIITRLLCAKTRVAPLKTQSLPRLELCAALVGSQLAARLKTDCQIKDQTIFFWTDSEVVLHWINAQSSTYKTFVANRVAKIQMLTSPVQWRHVSSKSNPADLLSRGCSAKALADNALWFQGPMFLHGKQELWPPMWSIQLQIPSDIETKKNKAITLLTGQVNGEWIYQINHHNSFGTLQRIIGYVLRFINNTRCKQKSRPEHMVLSTIEQEHALAVIIKIIQAEDFKEEIQNLKQDKEIKMSSSLRSLSPFLDDISILRVGGRLEAAALPYDAKHQMVLPYNDPLVKLLFIKVHEENKHCGPQALLGTLRQRFWPIKGKTTARSIVQHCIRCNKARPQFVQQIMGNLPATRVTPARPFINTGVDYAGPLWVHYKVRGKRPTKAYLAVFCCFASKAVHLELVTELSTDAFIGALKRFISRRGRCQNLYSDNATNFIGARNELTELSSAIYSSSAQDQIKKTCNEKGIQFHFIPPRSPHFGGLWEAAVKSAKHLLLKSVASASLTYEELETVIVEIEAILNSRPLTPLSSDPSDLTALTPGHLLIGEALTAQVDSKANSTKLSLLSRWKLVSQVKHEFWKRWSNEYLNELQQRHKWTRQTDNIKLGELVIIKEDNVPVMRWPLGRVVEVYNGPDGAVRVADVKTATGTYKRAIHRLARLPIDTDTATESKEDENTRKRRDKMNEEPPRRPKMARHYSLITLLAVLLMLPIAWCEPVKITKFDPNAGIHFEHIGSSKIISSEWKLVVYYDLKPLRAEIQLLKNGTKTMNHMCEQIQPTTICEELVTQFQRTNTELDLDKGLLRSHRQKRGALNFVGNIANSLFGVLDSEYAFQMSQTITDINDNEQHLASMMKKQISVVDSTINIIKHDQITTQMVFKRLEGRLTDIKNQLRHNEQEEQKEHTFQMFLLLAFQLSIMTSNAQRVQAALINVLTNVHNGQISPQLISPQQLNDEILKITAHLAPTMQIPGYQGDLLSIYKLMKVKAAITENHAIFQISIPLTSLNQFNLYRLIPIPTKINNTMVAIKLFTTILAINAHRDQYFPTTVEKLQSCFRMENELYLCANNQPTYNKGSEVCACEVSLFNNETRSHCNLEHREDHIWAQVNDRNRWMFALATPIQITAVCDNQVSRLSLEGSGFIELTAGCVLKYQLLTITSNPILSSFTSTSYTAFGHIVDVNVTKPASVPVLDTTEIEYGPSLTELSRLQEILDAHEINNPSNKLQAHLYHSFTVSYLALFLAVVIILAIFIIYKRHERQGAPSMASPATPTNLPMEEPSLSEIIRNAQPQAAPRYSNSFCVDP